MANLLYIGRRRNNWPVDFNRQVSEDREFRKSQTRERISAVFFWLALAVFVGFWIHNAYFEYGEIALYRKGKRTVGTLTEISLKYEKEHVKYDFIDEDGMAHSGICSLGRWNGPVPKMHGPLEVIFLPGNPDQNVPLACATKNIFLPFHLLMGFFFVFMSLMLLSRA